MRENVCVKWSWASNINQYEWIIANMLLFPRHQQSCGQDLWAFSGSGGRSSKFLILDCMYENNTVAFINLECIFRSCRQIRMSLRLPSCALFINSQPCSAVNAKSVTGCGVRACTGCAVLVLLTNLYISNSVNTSWVIFKDRPEEWIQLKYLLWVNKKYIII